MHGDDWFTFAELTDRLAALVWVEEELADLLDSWSRLEDHAGTAVLFATTSRHHRWHGEVIRHCLPTSPQLADRAKIAAPTSEWVDAIATLGELTDAGATTARLRAVVRVIDPWLDREIGALRELSRPVSDAATMRWLRFVAIDHHDDGEGAASLLASRAAEATRFDDHVLINSLNLGGSIPSDDA